MEIMNPRRLADVIFAIQIRTQMQADAALTACRGGEESDSIAGSYAMAPVAHGRGILRASRSLLKDHSHRRPGRTVRKNQVETMTRRFSPGHIIFNGHREIKISGDLHLVSIEEAKAF